MDSLLGPQVLTPVVVALLGAVGTYFVIIKKTRAELAAQTRSAWRVLRDAADIADTNQRIALRAEMQELRQKFKECEIDKGDMVLKLSTAQTHIMILETRVRVLEQMPR